MTGHAAPLPTRCIDTQDRAAEEGVLPRNAEVGYRSTTPCGTPKPRLCLLLSRRIPPEAQSSRYVIRFHMRNPPDRYWARLGSEMIRNDLCRLHRQILGATRWTTTKLVAPIPTPLEPANAAAKRSNRSLGLGSPDRTTGTGGSWPATAACRSTVVGSMPRGTLKVIRPLPAWASGTMATQAPHSGPHVCRGRDRCVAGRGWSRPSGPSPALRVRATRSPGVVEKKAVGTLSEFFLELVVADDCDHQSYRGGRSGERLKSSGDHPPGSFHQSRGVDHPHAQLALRTGQVSEIALVMRSLRLHAAHHMVGTVRQGSQCSGAPMSSMTPQHLRPWGDRSVAAGDPRCSARVGSRRSFAASGSTGSPGRRWRRVSATGRGETPAGRGARRSA